MVAAVLAGPGLIRIEEQPVPDPRENEVRVRLEGCGVCGSNLAPWEGRPWFSYPFEAGQPGHEGWGYVDAIGSRVTTVGINDRVALLSYRAFAEFDVAPESAVVRLPPEFDGQPFPGEALGCALNVFHRSDIRKGQTVAIVGIGFLGAVLTQLCARAGANVIAITRRPFALEMARMMGAAETIPMDDHCRIIEKVKRLTTDLGCDRVIEAVGAQWPLDLAGELTRERGRLIIAGYHQDGPRQVNMQLWNWRGLDVINAHERETAVYVNGIRDAVESMTAGNLNPQPLYTHEFSLERLASALNAMKARPAEFLKAWVRIS
ncbi:MAG TPA: zinc-binding dehydrogenase [Verrucomicrobiae bacterium]|nr:zinc-binding dehydrogenase [Verrucomicrobiae bacterium]